jgi:putative endonuclease
MGRSQVRGRAGEALAAAYLELMGYAIEARNTRVAGVEVDLVASDDRTIALVEVKFRTRTDYGGAALAVDRTKRERMVRAARAVGDHEGRAVRIDVIAIEPHEHGATIRHYPNAVTEGT